MSVTHGADVEALRASARQLADAAHELLSANIRLTHRVYDVRWNGPDAAGFRAAWESEYSPQLSQVSAALNRAAAEVLEQAADQERASSATGATSSATDDLQARLNTQRDLLVLAANTAQVARAMAAHPDAWRSLETFNRAWNLAEDFASPLERHGGALLGVLGTAVGAHGLVRGAAEGDAAAVVQNGVPLAVTALVSRGIVATGTGAAVTSAWGIGSLIGTGVNKAMEGTTYGARVEENFAEIFDATGVAGPVVGTILTPVVLLKSGLDMLDDDAAPPIP